MNLALGGLGLVITSALMMLLIRFSRVRRGNRGLMARKLSFLPRYDLTEERHPWAVVFLAGLAAATASEFDGGVGLVIAVVAAVLGGVLVRTAWVLDALGAVGSVALLGLVLLTPECYDGDKAGRLVMFSSLALLVFVAVVCGQYWGGWNRFPLVTLFGLLDFVRFATAPVGLTLSPDDPLVRTLVTGAMVIAMGFLVGFIPRLATPLIALATFGVELSMGAAFPQLGCGSSAPDRMEAVVLFLVIYFLVRWFRTRFA